MSDAPFSSAASAEWTGVPVAITGTGGFVGSDLVEALVTAGAEVRALTSYRAQRDLDAFRADEYAI